MTAISYDTSKIENRADNVAIQFRERVRSSGSKEAYSWPAGEGQPWHTQTWGEVGEKVEQIAAGLISIGVSHEQRVGIASETRVEWIWCDLAIMCAGAATTTVYPSTHAEDVAFILSDSESVACFAEDASQLAKLREQRNEMPHLSKVILIDGEGDGDWVMSMNDLIEAGKKHLAENKDVVEQATAKISGGDLATLIYTSGTTGRPKGVRLRHSSWTYEGTAIQAQGILTENDKQFLWLPMAHSFGKVLLTTQLAIGFPTAVDGTVEKIVDNLAVVKPTFMGAAPRIFEKAHGRIVTMTQQEGGAKEKIFTKAFAVGKEVAERKRKGESVPFGLKAQHAVFDKLVFSKVRERFGGNVRFFISGAAALNRDIAEFFDAAGLPILEGYGLTETSAGAFVNHPDKYKFGTVGPVLPGGEAKIDPDTGEVMIKGPNVMDGYHNNPEETAKVLTDDGWLRTGDKGELDADGYLKITGRIKELFKTSGGKYIAPPAIEAKFKAICPYASQYMVFGNERNYCVALVTLDPDGIADWAAQNGMEGKSYEEIVSADKTREMVEGYVEETNKKLNRWETVKKFRILDHDLSVDSGELTPSMKVKRGVVESNYSGLIDEMYNEDK